MDLIQQRNACVTELLSTCARSCVKAPSSKPSPSTLAPDRSGNFPDKALIKVDFPSANNRIKGVNEDYKQGKHH